MLANDILAFTLFLTPCLASSLVLTPPQPSQPLAPLLTSRQTTPSSSNDTSTPLNHDGSLNLSAWDTLTAAHCQAVLSQLPRATNPSGTAVCYNLPTLDADNGEFTADLRLYSVSAPVRDWKDVNVSRLAMAVDFPYADVETLSVNGHEGGQLDGTTGKVAARDSAEDASGQKNTLLQMYMLKGKIHTDKLSSNLSTSDLQVLLIPQLTITSQPGALKVQPSTNEAIFITGVFSSTVILAPSQTEVPPAFESVLEGKMPGRTMALFPTGLIVTGGWTLIGMLVVGVTIWEKKQYRAAYFRNLERESRLRRRTSSVR